MSIANACSPIMLCDACDHLVKGKSRLLAVPIPLFRAAPIFWHHWRAALIEVAAEAGCAMCRTLWSKLTDAEKDLVRDTANLPPPSWNPLRVFTRPAFAWYGWSTGDYKIIFQFGFYARKKIELDILPV